MNQLSRRDFLKIAGLSAAGAAAWQLGIKPQVAGLVEVSRSRVLMGTIVNLTLVGEDSAAAEKAISATFEQMGGLEAALSRHRPGSELSRLNRNGAIDAAGPHLLAVLEQAEKMSHQTGGAFDVTVKPLLDLYQAGEKEGNLPTVEALAATRPLVNYRNLHINGARVSFARQGMGITLDGIGKGYIVDEGARILRRRGFANVLVEAGGDLLASGAKGDGSPWTLGVQPPRAEMGDVAARFRVTDRAVATSGDYMQPFTPDLSQHHILDPRQGISPPALSSVSVAADTACQADALSTALMVMGPAAGLALIERLPGAETLLITKEGMIHRSSGFPSPL